MAKLELKKGSESSHAFAMIAKDGERVEFDNNCICEGQVEVWLNRLLATMRSTLRFELTRAVGAYDDKPRGITIRKNVLVFFIPGGDQ